jgi:iron complex transport system substrate-binding protein
MERESAPAVAGLNPALARAATDWLAAMGAAPYAAVPRFAPETLKQVLDQALALGAAAGRLPAAMPLIADVERRLAALVHALEIDRRAGTVAGRPASRVAVVTDVAPEGLVLGGLWVPGLAAAAGLSAAGPSEGSADVLVAPAGLARLAPDAVVFAPAGLSADAAAAAVRSLRDAEGWCDIDAFRAGRLHVIDGTRYVGRPGPEIARSAELLAFVVHGERSGVTAAPDEAAAGNGVRRE